jgi:pyruvate formate lyase activating enzyme
VQRDPGRHHRAHRAPCLERELIRPDARSQAPTSVRPESADAEPSCLVTDIQRFAVHDGPGIRTLVFVKGCPLECAWCANPETQASGAEVVWLQDRCIRCRACVQVCAAQALHFEDDAGAVTQAGLAHDRSRCVACAACVAACITGARALLGRSMTVAEVLREVEKDAVFYQASGGGVTFSGGEPALRAPFVAAVLAGCRERGFGTAVETCGHVPWEQLAELVPPTDLFFYDVKHLDPQVHRRHTGVSNELILENLRRLAGAGAAVVVRTPVVPGFNAEAAEIAAIARHVATLRPGVLRLELLPYHRYGSHKYGRLGRAYALDDVRAPSVALLAELAAAARAEGIDVQVGG